MVPSASSSIASERPSPLRLAQKLKAMSDAAADSTSPAAAGRGSSPTGIRQVLAAEAGRQRLASAAAAANSRAAAGLPPTLGMSSALRPSFSHREGMMAAAPPALRASQSLGAACIPPSLRSSASLDYAAAMMPPSFRPSASLDLAAAMPPSFRASQSLDLRPPSLGRSSSIELAAARRAVAMGYSSMYDPRRLLLAQQAAAASPFPRSVGSSSMMGMMMPGRNMPNEGLSGQGLDLLRAASLSLPNRMGGGLGPRAHSVGSSPFASAAAAARMRGMNMPMSRQMMAPGFSPEPKGVAASAIHGTKRKAEGDSDDEEASGDKVFIPDVRDLDILCGRGKSSTKRSFFVNHPPVFVKRVC